MKKLFQEADWLAAINERRTRLSKDHLQRIEQDKAEADAADWRARFQKAALPADIKDALWKGEDEAGNEIVRTGDVEAIATAIEGRRHVIVAGPTDTGKSYAAAMAMADVARYGKFISALEWCIFRETDEAARAPYILADYLIVDDLGLEAEADFSLKRIEQLAYLRHANRRKTIYTTNLNGDQLERYGARFMRRINESGAWVDMDCRAWEI